MTAATGMLIATVGLVLVSLIGVLISYFLLRHSYDPNVIVYATSDPDRPTIINLVIENVGSGPAYDVRFQTSRVLPARAFGMNPEKLQKPDDMTAGPIVNGIPMLAPNDKRVITWGQYTGLEGALGSTVVEVVASYSSRGVLPWDPTDHVTRSALEVFSFAGTVANRPWYVRLANATEDIKRSLAKFESGKNSLKIEITTQPSGEDKSEVEELQERHKEGGVS